MSVARYPLPVVPPTRRLQVVRRLVAEAAAADACRHGGWRESLLVRNAAMVTLAITAGARSGEVSAIDLADWRRRRSAVVLRRDPAGRGPGFQEEQPLDDTTAALLRMWLPHRARVLATLDGGHVPALFVSLRPNSRAGVLWPAGMRLHRYGVRDAWRRTALRWHTDGEQWNWVPTRLEQLRRPEQG
ncbi:hypothetical protein GCM10010495_37380 [Kitasatospora herbaricolor]|uniref:hypothetical protein n=1 Tax=Kitasatospora herbaricolor TaxID=68217 RepID=UPI00174A2361|nr:hypothetical protein [Kitasatospora herbaricolor]MDQ0306967.1 integrase [Kitasatospora herbaricolor]GGV19019.1 hypothetical protein GCM10010495_37380 [Kitasatospora herbaricolor]